MKQQALHILLLSMLFTATSAFAGHDHGSGHGSVAPATPPNPADEQAAKATEQLLESCVRNTASIQQHINRIQANMAGRRAVGSMNEELKLLEQKLKEAKELARSLQIF